MGSGDDRRELQPKSPNKASVSQLTRLAHEHLQKGDLHKAMEHFESAVEQSRTVEDCRVKISCYLNAGACLVSLGQYECGLSFLESASTIVKTIGDLEEGENAGGDMLEMSADVFYNAAVAEQGLHEYEKAVSSFCSCIDQYIKAGSKEHAAEAFTSLASCYREAGQLEKEVTSLMSAQQLYNEVGDCGSEALVCVDLTKAFLSCGKKEKGKQMISHSKMLCLRVNNPKIQGKLHTQFGLVYTSLGMFNEAIQSFEKALPLVRCEGETTTASLQMEASVLQNIGAAYNEKGMFSEAVIYHREAAALHGKAKNYNSEAKCLCNLAFAHSQLKDYRSAMESFSHALDKAQSAKNPYLRFQACEGLGATNFHLGQHSEAITHFNQALAVLEEIKQDTGIPRERVMEKLSDAAEALQLQTREAQQKKKKKSPRSRTSGVEPNSYSMRAGIDGTDHDREERTSPKAHTFTTTAELHSTRSTHSLDHPENSSPKLSSRNQHPLAPESNEFVRATQLGVESLPLPSKRGTGFLPPIDPSRSPQLTTRREHQDSSTLGAAIGSVFTMSESRRSTTKHGKPMQRKVRKTPLPQITESGKRVSTKLLPESYDEQLHAYMNSYREDRSGGSATSSSSESSLSGASQLSQESANQLGGSIFSRHATRRHSHRLTPTHQPPKPSFPPEHSLSQGASPLHSPSIFPVQEGSLALGPNARQMFTTQTQPVQQRQKRRRSRNPQVQTRIVPRASPNPEMHGTKSRYPPESPDYTDSLGHQPHSKVCLLL